MPDPSWVWEHFEKDSKKYKSNNTHHGAFCHKCLAAKIFDLENADSIALSEGVIAAERGKKELRKDALEMMEPICGKVTTLSTHLLKCEWVDNSIKARITDEREAKKPGGLGTVAPPPLPQASSSNSASHGPPPPKRPKQQPFVISTVPKWTKARNIALGSDLCRLFVSCGWPWASAENPEFTKFCIKWLPGSELPDRRELSGRILDREVVKCIDVTKGMVKGGLATGQSDGWKNVTKTSLVASMMSVKSESHPIRVHNVSADHKTANHLLGIVEDDIDYCEEEYEVIVIGWCTDAGGEARAMRVRLHKRRPWLIVPDCWGHQVNLIVGDYFKLKSELTQTAEQAILVVVWFNNHSRALGLLRKRMLDTLEKCLALIKPVITRWTCHYISLSRLLEISRAIQTCAVLDDAELLACVGKKRADMEKASEILALIGDKTFWKRIEKIKNHLEPLAIATNVTQGASTRLDHVLLTLGNLYRIYDEQTFKAADPDISACVISSIERRWAKSDQEPFILAVFLNPWIRDDLFGSHQTFTRFGLLAMARRAFKRFWPDKPDPDSDFNEAFVAYSGRAGPFSDEEMQLGSTKVSADKKGIDIDIPTIWGLMKRRGSEETGWNQLCNLAIRILSVVANSAGCERLFSLFGTIHTKLRNRLSHEKVTKIATLKMQLRREHMQQGLALRRSKRKFGEVEDGTDAASAVSQGANGSDAGVSQVLELGEEEAGGADTRAVLSELEKDVDDDDDEPFSNSDEDDDSLALPDQPSASLGGPHRRVRLFFSPTAPLKLAEVFDFKMAQRPNSKLNFFWKGGIRNLAKEAELYELLDQGSEPGGSEAPGASTDSAIQVD